MQARVVVFPVKGRAWCFASPRATAPAAACGGGDGGALLPPPPPTVKDLWRGIAGGGRTASENAEAVVDFVADKVLDSTGSAFSSLALTAFSHAARIWGVSDGGVLAAADEPGVDRVRERAGGVDEEPDPQVGSVRVWGLLSGGWRLWSRKWRDAESLGVLPFFFALLWCSFGLKLLSRVRPSEVLLKSVTKDVSLLEIVHPAR